jgi:hypothetical protein
MTHTPGPWKYDSKHADYQVYSIDGKQIVAFCPKGYPEANARLITAAVNSYDKNCGEWALESAEGDLLGEMLEMLDAMKALVDYRDRVGALGFQLEKADDYINNIRSAIAYEGRPLATGELQNSNEEDE